MISKSSWEYIKAKDLYFIKTSWVNKGETTLDGFPISLIGCTMMPGSHKRGFVVFIFVYLHWNKKCSVIPSITSFTGFNRTFLLKWPAAMETYWNKRLVWPTWLPFHCFETPIWRTWRHVKTLYFLVKQRSIVEKWISSVFDWAKSLRELSLARHK